MDYREQGTWLKQIAMLSFLTFFAHSWVCTFQFLKKCVILILLKFSSRQVILLLSDKSLPERGKFLYMENDKLKVFEDRKIRTAWDEEQEEWYFSVTDVVAVLTDSVDPKQYIKKMRSRDPELTIDRALATYLQKGYTREWINQRLQAIQVRKELTDEWQDRGVTQGKEYAILTNGITRAWSGMNTQQYKKL